MAVWIPNKANAHERQRKRPDKISKKHANSLFDSRNHTPAWQGRKSSPQDRFDTQMIKYTTKRPKRQETDENGIR